MSLLFALRPQIITCNSVFVSNSKSEYKLRSILILLHPNNTIANLSTTCILSSNLSANNTHYLLAAATTYLLTTVTSNISATTNSNTTTKLTLKQNSKAKDNTTKLEISDSSPSTDLHFLVVPKDTAPNNQEPNQTKSLTSNILPATVTNNKLLVAIFSFELKEPSSTFLFSGAVLKEKLITAMYTNAKVDGHSVKLILDSHQVDHAASARIITADGATKTLIGEINDFFIEVNSIIIPIKVLVIEAT
ncbi:hypothetical protein G9A89_001198 [Geosiphon pyriformis]|nr:hypothetical protein G9A89_001198 [Geosiphon pyriformis]